MLKCVLLKPKYASVKTTARRRFAAYKAGIRAHMELIGIPGTRIEAFLASTSVEQDPAKLTMSNIMIQKYIAMSHSFPRAVGRPAQDEFYCTDAAHGNYNEATGIYKGFKRPSHTFLEASIPIKRTGRAGFAVPTTKKKGGMCGVFLSYLLISINYNIEQKLKANPNSRLNPTYLNQPVWWDKP